MLHSLFLYKLHNHLLPPGVQSYYTLSSQVHQHDTRRADKLHVAPIGSGLKKRSLHHQAAIHYKKYPNLQLHLPLISFKYHTKIMLLCEDEMSIYVYY